MLPGSCARKRLVLADRAAAFAESSWIESCVATEAATLPAYGVVYLASDESKFVARQVIGFDGVFTAQ
jgi:hypothetical protein